MDLLIVLQIIAALATMGTGLLALIKPSAAYAFTGLNPHGVRGISEFRSIFGGLFIALGLAPFLLGKTAYLMLGIGYLGIALARSLSIVFDKSYDRSNLLSLLVEIIFGLILII